MFHIADEVQRGHDGQDVAAGFAALPTSPRSRRVMK